MFTSRHSRMLGGGRGQGRVVGGGAPRPQAQRRMQSACCRAQRSAAKRSATCTRAQRPGDIRGQKVGTAAAGQRTNPSNGHEKGTPNGVRETCVAQRTSAAHTSPAPRKWAAAFRGRPRKSNTARTRYNQRCLLSPQATRVTASARRSVARARATMRHVAGRWQHGARRPDARNGAPSGDGAHA